MLVLAVVFLINAYALRAATPDLSQISVRAGYALSISVSGIEDPRFLALDNQGRLFISRSDDGEIVCCTDKDADGVYEIKTSFISGHPTVHAMQWREGWLWFAESGAIYKAQDVNGDGRAEKELPILRRGTLPSGGSHWYRPLLILNKRIYTAIGDSGNITDESATKRQKIWSYSLEGKDEQLFASGIRNTEKLVVRPGTEEIWGMDQGSDWFGRVIEGRNAQQGQPITDSHPHDEMNHYLQNAFYGHPIICEDSLPRYEFMDRRDILAMASRNTHPEWNAGAHWAPESMTFYTGTQFPNTQGDAFVSYHGSWNRTQPVGNCVTRVLFDQGRPYGEIVYVDFLNRGSTPLGRPVDSVVASDGSLLISDDGCDVVYRLRYAGSGQTQ